MEKWAWDKCKSSSANAWRDSTDPWGMSTVLCGPTTDHRWNPTDPWGCPPILGGNPPMVGGSPPSIGGGARLLVEPHRRPRDILGRPWNAPQTSGVVLEATEVLVLFFSPTNIYFNFLCWTIKLLPLPNVLAS
jgi:hypothetical protein